MKLIRKLITALAVSFAVIGNAQVCTGDFQWLINGTTVSFIGSTSPNITSVYYSFGDGNYDYTGSTYVNHTYTAPGNYNVCIFYSDSNICADSTCHTITIDSCHAVLNYYVNGLNAYFTGTAVGATPSAVYQWNFGDNSTSTQQNPVHHYTSPGNYTVCFAFYDPNSTCADSICVPVAITGGCYADFAAIDSLGYTFFINQSSLGLSGMYSWDFGDSNYDNMYSPSHQYASPGTYLVCLSAFDSLQNFCDSTCHYVTATNVAGVNDNKSENISLKLSPNPTNGDLTASFYIDSPSGITLSLFDLTGRAVQSTSRRYYGAGPQTETISTEGLPPGTYLLRLKTDKTETNSKLVITSKY